MFSSGVRNGVTIPLNTSYTRGIKKSVSEYIISEILTVVSMIREREMQPFGGQSKI